MRDPTVAEKRIRDAAHRRERAGNLVRAKVWLQGCLQQARQEHGAVAARKTGGRRAVHTAPHRAAGSAAPPRGRGLRTCVEKKGEKQHI